MSIRQLRAIVAVADAGGYAAAARQLHIAQSSLSRSVLDIERRVGVSLFERTTRSVVPTPDGAEFLTIARGLLAHVDAALNHFEGALQARRAASAGVQE